jgi:hypothetical protein
MDLENMINNFITISDSNRRTVGTNMSREVQNNSKTCLNPLKTEFLPTNIHDHLCGLVVRVSGYRSRGPGLDSQRFQIF